MSEQLWKGRFSKAVDSRVNDFNSSIRFDQRMIAEDMHGSAVHAAMLAKQEQLADWQWVQKRFEKLQLHRKQQNGLNIWTCAVTGPRKSRRLHGYLLEDPHVLFADLPPNNPYLSLSFSTDSVRQPS